MTRRDSIKLISAGAVMASSANAQGARFRVREAAGLRRFSFPVRASWVGQAVPPARAVARKR